MVLEADLEVTRTHGVKIEVDLEVTLQLIGPYIHLYTYIDTHSFVHAG